MKDSLSVLLASIVRSSGQVLDETDPFGNLHLLLFRQLRGRSRHIRGRMVQRDSLLKGRGRMEIKMNEQKCKFVLFAQTS